MDTTLIRQFGTGRGIAADDVWEPPGTTTIESQPLLADPLRLTRESRFALAGEVWVPVEEVRVPAWVRSTVEALSELLALEPDWDSYGARAVDPFHVYTVLQVLALVMRDDTPAPSIGPTNRGGVQVEWHEHGIDLEIETLSTHTLRVSFEDSRTNTEWEDEIGAELGPLIRSIAILSSR